MTRIVSLCGFLGLLLLASPAMLASAAMAGCEGDAQTCWAEAHDALSDMGNRIASLQANPDADDAYKGPIIDHLSTKRLRLRAVIGARWPHWPTPCCYSRRPIYIR